MNTIDTPARDAQTPALAWVVRAAASAHFIALISQVALVPVFLGGYGQAFDLHRANARVLLALGVVQALAALVNSPRRTGYWLTLFAVATAGLETVQIWLGQTGQTEAHVLTGFAIWSLSIAFAVKVWFPAWAEQARAS